MASLPIGKQVENKKTVQKEATGGSEAPSWGFPRGGVGVSEVMPVGYKRLYLLLEDFTVRRVPWTAQGTQQQGDITLP